MTKDAKTSLWQAFNLLTVAAVLCWPPQGWLKIAAVASLCVLAGFSLLLACLLFCIAHLDKKIARLKAEAEDVI